VTRTRPPFRVRWVVLGLLLIEIGWVLAVPPFRGVDEWDHAYRASAVAHGQWVTPPTAATRGTGAIVRAQPDIVEAARAECERLDYTGDAECVGQPTEEYVEIASGAGRYHPVFYAVVGLPTLVLDGATALYGMRLVALLLCLLVLAAAFKAAREWDEPLVAITVLCGLTPMVLYSTSIVAPNGLEMAAGLALWAALGALAQTNDRSGTRFHVATAVVAAALLITLRSLGPLWALMILCTALLAWPGLGRRIWGVVRSPSGIAAVAFLAAVSIGSLAWILIQDSLVIGREDTGAPIPFDEKVEIAARRIPQWILQWIGAFPYRAQPAPAVVYVIYLLLLGWMLVVALRYGNRRYRVAIAAGLALSLLIPFVITVATLDAYGTSWQGRYGLPYLLGLPLLFGVILAGQLNGRGRRAFLIATVPLLAVGHAASVVGVLNRERNDSPQSGTDAWMLMPPTAVLAVLVVFGVCLALVPLIRSSAHRGGAAA
jgi:hypothetical protein